MFLDWPVDPFVRFDDSRSSLSPEVPSDDQQRDALPASTRSRWRQNTLQAPPQVLQRTGWDRSGPFLTGGLRCITWNTRGLVGSVFSKQKNRKFKLKYLKKLFDTNNILCLQEVHGKGRVSPGYSGGGSAISFFGTFFLITKKREGRLSAFTGTIYLKKLL